MIHVRKGMAELKTNWIIQTLIVPRLAGWAEQLPTNPEVCSWIAQVLELIPND